MNLWRPTLWAVWPGRIVARATSRPCNRTTAYLRGLVYPSKALNDGIARSEPDGTRWRTVGEVKGKNVNGVGSQQPCTVRWNMVYPALLPTIKTCDKLASSTASRELRSKIRQFQHRRFHITLKYCWHSEFSCFPCYDIWYDILVNWSCVDTRWQ